MLLWLGKFATRSFEEVVAHVTEHIACRSDVIERGMMIYRVRAATIGKRLLKTID